MYARSRSPRMAMPCGVSGIATLATLLPVNLSHTIGTADILRLYYWGTDCASEATALISSGQARVIAVELGVISTVVYGDARDFPAEVRIGAVDPPNTYVPPTDNTGDAMYVDGRIGSLYLSGGQHIASTFGPQTVGGGSSESAMVPGRSYTRPWASLRYPISIDLLESQEGDASRLSPASCAAFLSVYASQDTNLVWWLNGAFVVDVVIPDTTPTFVLAGNIAMTLILAKVDSPNYVFVNCSSSGA